MKNYKNLFNLLVVLKLKKSTEGYSMKSRLPSKIIKDKYKWKMMAGGGYSQLLPV